MTIIDEMTEKDKYEKLKFVEFLEVIGRIAEQLFQSNKDMVLYDKVYSLLQRLFSIIPTSVKEPSTDTDIVSESDEEEYEI